MARTDNITSLFGKSPIAPLQKHMKQAHSCLKDFNAFAKQQMLKIGTKQTLSEFQLIRKRKKQNSRAQIL